MFKFIHDLFGTNSPDKREERSNMTPIGRMERTTDILPQVSPDGVASCRRILHRTSPEKSRKIIEEQQIWSINSVVSFSISPGQTNQAEHKGVILVFDWSGPVRICGDARQNELLHVMSPNYVESVIGRPSNGNFLALIGIIEPDVCKVEDKGKDALDQVRYIINDRVKIFTDSIIISVT